MESACATQAKARVASSPRCRDEREISAVGSIDVNAKWIRAAQREHLMQRIDGAGSGCAQRHHHRADVSLSQCGLERRQIHAAGTVSRPRW